jgi:hypothetical protein
MIIPIKPYHHIPIQPYKTIFNHIMVIIWLCFPIGDRTGNWAQTLRVDAGCLVESIHPSWSPGCASLGLVASSSGLTMKKC